MDEVGIYRVSGAALDISTLKAAFDSGKASTFGSPCPAAACSPQARVVASKPRPP